MEYPIRILETPEEMAQIEKLHRQVWGGSDLDVIPSHLNLALSHNGGVVLGAFDGEEMIGFVIGFLGASQGDQDRPLVERLKHASHEMAVDPKYRGKGIGYALKVAQRQVVRAQGIDLITWTYDPLLSLNAHLNIRLLGAVCNTYRVNEYGTMQDELNRGIASDRFQVDWWLNSNRVSQRIEGPRTALDLAHFLGAGAEKINEVSLDERGRPRPGNATSQAQGNLVIVEIPSDYLALKSSDLGLAIAWRELTSELFQALFRAGFLVTDFIFLREERIPRSYYILANGEVTLG